MTPANPLNTFITALTQQPCIHEHSMKPAPFTQGLCPRCITIQIDRLFSQGGQDPQQDDLRATNLKLTELCLAIRDLATRFLTSRSIADHEKLEQLISQLNKLPEEFCPISSQLITEQVELKKQLAHTQRHLEEQQRMTYLAVQREHRARKDQLEDQIALAGWIHAAHSCGIGDPANLIATCTARRHSPAPLSTPDTGLSTDQHPQISELHHLREQLASLKALIDGAPLVEFPSAPDGDRIDVALSHPLLLSLTRTLCQLFRLRPDTNYLEVELRDPLGGEFMLTLRPTEKPTPHELRLAAEREVRLLREALATASLSGSGTPHTEDNPAPDAQANTPAHPEPPDPILDHSPDTRRLLCDLFETDRLESMSAKDAALANRLLQLLYAVRTDGMGIAAVLADAMRAATPANIAIAIRVAAGIPIHADTAGSQNAPQKAHP